MKTIERLLDGVLVGIQSFNEDCLKLLNRIHSSAQAESTFRAARAAGFKNISIDLIFGMPGQKLEMLNSDLDRALDLNPEHISIYNLMYEEGTPLTAANLPRLDEELELEMYDTIRRRLSAAGFVHYEISNFSKPDYECRHNLLYWTGGEYIGCGPAAHSHYADVRYANAADLSDYCANGARIEFKEQLAPTDKARETFVMQLRQIAGAEVPPAISDELAPVLRRLEENGLVIINGTHVRLHENALFVSDSVFSELV